MSFFFIEDPFVQFTRINGLFELLPFNVTSDISEYFINTLRTINSNNNIHAKQLPAT